MDEDWGGTSEGTLSDTAVKELLQLVPSGNSLSGESSCNIMTTTLYWTEEGMSIEYNTDKDRRG